MRGSTVQVRQKIAGVLAPGADGTDVAFATSHGDGRLQVISRTGHPTTYALTSNIDADSMNATQQPGGMRCDREIPSCCGLDSDNLK